MTHPYRSRMRRASGRTTQRRPPARRKKSLERSSRSSRYRDVTQSLPVAQTAPAGCAGQFAGRLVLEASSSRRISSRWSTNMTCPSPGTTCRTAPGIAADCRSAWTTGTFTSASPCHTLHRHSDLPELEAPAAGEQAELLGCRPAGRGRRIGERQERAPHLGPCEHGGVGGRHPLREPGGCPSCEHRHEPEGQGVRGGRFSGDAGVRCRDDRQTRRRGSPIPPACAVAARCSPRTPVGRGQSPWRRPHARPRVRQGLGGGTRGYRGTRRPGGPSGRPSRPRPTHRPRTAASTAGPRSRPYMLS
jgi:hypothetical protein